MTDLRVDEGSLEQARNSIGRAIAAAPGACVPAPDLGSSAVADVFGEVEAALSMAERSLGDVLIDAREAVQVVGDTLRAEDVRLGQRAC